jgi:sulfopyruvate decarboxylase TPP-binding subunit
MEKEFWNFLCKELKYVFFSGVACPGLSPFYKVMSSDFMHYVPAVNEKVALGIVSGAYLAGYRGGLLIDMKFAYDMTSFLSFNTENRIPLLIIGYNDQEDFMFNVDLPVAYITTEDFKDDVRRVSTKSESDKIPGFIVIDKGVI